MATGLRVEIVEKLITARIERPDDDGDFLRAAQRRRRATRSA
jgi:hypothetical protein